MAGYLAERIRAARTRAGLSQRALGELCGIERCHVSRMESGRHDVSEATLERVAGALRITMGELCAPGQDPTIWLLDTGADGHDETLWGTEAEVYHAVLYHHDLPELPDHWALERVPHEHITDEMIAALGSEELRAAARQAR